MTPESFVVQIYRSQSEDEAAVAGVVQRVGSDRKRSFKSAQELWALLTISGREGKGPTFNERPKRNRR